MFPCFSGEDELWIIDFQPFEFFGASPVNETTGYLSSNNTGTCSNVKDNLRLSEGFFKDDFMQTENRTGSKNLFDVYQRGEYDENGTRVDVVRVITAG